MSNLYVFLWITLLLAVSPAVKGLTLCDTDVTLEVVENTASNVFTCTGAGSRDTITWIVQRSNGNADLATCTPDSCNNPYKPQFEASRPADDRSTLTVSGSTTSYLQYIQGKTIVCRTGTATDSPQQTQCTVDVVAVPSVTCDAHYNTGTSSPWTVTANCSLSGAYSYLNRYTCNLIQTSPTTKSLGSGSLIVTSGSGGKYKTGYCQVTASYPDVTGVYSYKMAVTPGRQDVPVSFGGQSSFEIKRPSTPPRHNCPQYVEESQGTSCTCTATDLGQPAGVVRWTSSMTNQLSLSNVNKDDNGTTKTCEVMWNGQRRQSVTYTLQVAYGPSRVSITHPPFPYDTNGQQQLTLTCAASGVNPAPTFTWVKGSANNVVGQGRTYSFRPQPPGDDNSVFVCRAVNTITGTSRQDNTTLTLNYPPTQDPVINIASTPPISGGHLYQGDRVTLTCAVTGGKPFGATTVTFTCPGKRDSPDTVGTSGVTSTVTFDSLTAVDHDKVCTCTTRWRNTNWYNKTKTVKLFVNSPPSTPTITKPSSNDYPPIATVTQSATLTCNSTPPGVPISTYTWPITQGGQQGTTALGRRTLTFDTISKELDGETVSCRARNRFTDNRHSVPDGNFTLEVYYKPEISTKAVEGTDPNQCEITSSDKSQCLVTEGQRVHIRCSASSNPQAADITWKDHSRNNPDLLIESAKRADTGTYNCSVETGRGNDANDRRLPLKGFSLFTVLVTYPSSISSFEVNSSPASTLTVNASRELNLSCRAVGRPPPETKLIHPSKSLIARTPQGSPSVADTPSVVSGKLTARCRDTGIYTCTADNAVGSAQQQHTISVFVQCKPEARNDAGNVINPSVNYRTEPVQLNFSVAAYPLPGLKQVKFFKQKPDDTAVGEAAEEGTVAVECFPDSTVSADVTCQITVDNIKSSYAGFYQAFVGNDFGDLKLEFEVHVNATYIGPGSGSGFPVGAVVGSIVAVLVVSAVIVAAVFLVIRRRKGMKQKPASPSARDRRGREEPEMIINSLYGTSGGGNDGEDFMITNSLYESSETAAPKRNQPSTSQASPYEDVDVPNAKPVIKPKPKPEPQHGASAAQVGSAGDVYATVNKTNGPQSAPEDSSSVYAVVNKKKKAPAELPAATPGAMEEKPKVGKKSAPKKPTQKGKGKKHPKKEDKHALDPAQSASSGAVYGNVTPLSMAPPEPEGTVYENYGFQKDDGAENDKQNPEPEPEESRTVNPDGLIYTTVAFSEKQREKEKNAPPQRDETEYVDIDFTRAVSE